MPQFVITGTDTGIGKTIFAAALVDALQAYYWKPIQSGLEGETDSEVVARLSGSNRIVPEAYRLQTPVSPHLAARLDNLKIDLSFLKPPTLNPLVIEGAGGLLVPLNEDCVFADVFAQWQIPVILCARTTLGTINHTLLSIDALRRREIPIHGVAFIGPEFTETQNIISKLGKVKILGRLPWLNTLTKETLRQAYLENFSL